MAKGGACVRDRIQRSLTGRFWRQRAIRLSVAVCLALPGTMWAQAPGAEQNFHRFVDSVVSPGTVLTPAGSAAFSQFVFKPGGFDRGALGYGEHFGIGLADNVDGKFLRDFAFPTMFRQDVVYNPDSASASTWHRVGHAMLHSVVLDAKQHHHLNFSGVPASFASAGISNLYQPQEQRNVTATLERVGTNAGGYLLGDLVSEFKPELCALVKKLHLPCKSATR